MKQKSIFFSVFAMMMVAMLSVGLVSCSDDDDNINKALVGTWTKQYDQWGVMGIKLTSSGKAYYNEWSVDEKPNFDNVSSPANVKVTDTTLRITHPQEPGYFEEYSYVLSEDKKSVSFTLLDYEKTNHGLSGTFIKVE